MLNAGSSRDCFRFRGDNDRLHFFTGEATTGGLATNRVFRDKSAWYHLVLAVDTTQATASDRVKIYVNGVQETSFAVTNYPAQNYTNVINSAVNHRIGKASNTYDEYFDGSMSHIHFIDGTAYSPSDFGQTDTTTGIWSPKITPSVTYGTNGYFLKFENSGSMGTDSSGNANNFTVNGTMTQIIDTPSNVFCTLNPLVKPGTGTKAGMANGNTHYNKTATGVGTNSQANGTLGASKGKYYFEAKANDAINIVLGISNIDYEFDSNGASLGISGKGSGVGWYSTGNKYVNGTSSSYSYTFTTNDIIGVAFDLDNNYIYFSKNGTWNDSGDPTSGSSGTGGIALTSNITYTPAVHNFNYGNASSMYFNFGNGYFGTTAVSSAQNPDDGIGIFEYDVPTGYRALCTKSINAQEYS